ncbi:DUF1549 and DUF1553 domain-containing protein [Tautonia plasticadhaerens]|uniref:Bacterial Ig-like domain (Group 2) n=1 Tax=Tautonia plasticadhaerens TaxID=2527974 RepID=A0A518H9H6_9BACT|nr:DUF1549 and DUF1553 domain-containing protein [Tautonia plasticadhaerens]QDV37499.1 Bacterial Ig-like domain (group 2) [Tautonia plasticadhaerens]
MGRRSVIAAILLMTMTAGTSSRAGDVTDATLRVTPELVRLDGTSDRQRLVVVGEDDGRMVDLTRLVTFRSTCPEMVQVDEGGIVRPLADGEAEVVATLDGREAWVRVHVSGMGEQMPPTFERDVMPLLTRLGCNSGPCHGKQRGQNGFQLSLLGFDPSFDHNALTKEARGRRVFPASPDQSLTLLKATAAVPHGGGKRIDPEGEEYGTIRRWIDEGMRRDPEGAPTVAGLDIWPTERSLAASDEQQVIVTARYSDGSTADVTHLAAFQSNESAVVSVDERGLIRAGERPGEAAISARFEGHFATCAVRIPLEGEVPDSLYEDLPKSNFIDGLVWDKLRTLGLTPSPTTDDATFLRRAHLDAIGRLPTPEETRAFLDDPSPEKRAVLVDRLLDRPEYADSWATKWMDLLRPNPYRVGIKSVWNLDAWIRRAFREEMPYDEFVRTIVAAQGSTFAEGPATIFRDRREPEELTTMVSQLFLGIRLECAKCHHHPFEVWGQGDFYGFAAYFAEVGRKGTGLSPPISGSEEVVFASGKGSVSHPLTGEKMDPAPLFGEAPEADDDPRTALASWMTDPDNPYFSRVIVNRVWADLMGVGLVTPVDDLRATNPPTNPELLDALADDFVRSGYDQKHLIRTIMTSRAYGLDSLPDERNVSDVRNYARHVRKRLPAEVLIDAICDVTGVPEDYDAAAPGTRATQIWTHRVPSTFLDTFGRPDANQDPPCERMPDTSVTQVLHLMNAPSLHDKITDDDGLAARLADSDLEPDAIVEDIYLRTYCRPPTDDERAVALALFDEPETGRRQAAEDLLWALINSAEFLFIN